MVVLAIVAVDCDGWVPKSSIFSVLSSHSLFIFQPNTSSKFIFALIKPKFLFFWGIFWWWLAESWVCLINRYLINGLSVLLW